MKFYLHMKLPKHNGENEAQIVTAVVHISDESTGKTIQQCYDEVMKLGARKRKSLRGSFEIAKVLLDDKKQLELRSLASSLAEGADLFVHLRVKVVEKNNVLFEKTQINTTKKGDEGKSDGKEVVKEDAQTKELLVAARRHMTAKREDLAAEVYRQLATNSSAMRGLAKIYMSAGRYSEAVSLLEKLVNRDGGSDARLVMQFGKALTESGDGNKAVTVLSRCVNDLKRSKQQTGKAGTGEQLFYDANVSLAAALESMGQQDAALATYLSVSQMSEKQHVDALLGYARVGYPLGHVSIRDVFIILLNAVARQRNDFELQRLFATIMSEPGAFEALKSELKDAWQETTAIVYIAKTLRDFGCLEPCLELLEHAGRLSADDSDVALLTMHVLENAMQPARALEHAITFVSTKLDRQLMRRISLADVAAIVKCMTASDSSTEDELTKLLAKCEALESREPKPSGDLLETELRLLAIYFTIVKICFVSGMCSGVPAMIKLLLPLHDSEKLHKTLIRNEQAYFTCIERIFRECPPPPTEPAATPIYVVGDSHVLSLAWRHCTLASGTTCNFIPVLVTGVKIWHLRKESLFYTKTHFNKAVSAIPAGSTVMFALGEIDCREGIIRAVQKCAYDGIDDAMVKLADIYVKMLTGLQKKHRFKVLVHPVAPVLRETAPITTSFNEILKRRLSRAAKLAWLDFCGDLIEPESGLLREEFAFDGAHLHPRYVQDVLEKCMQKVL